MKKMVSVALCMMCMVSLLSACKIEKKGNEDIGEIDADAEHITLTLSDDVTVDADITPQADYAEGLAVYKGCWWQEDYGGFEAFSENPGLWGKSISEIVSLLEECGVGSFTNIKLEDDYGPCITLTDEEGDAALIYAYVKEDSSSKIEQPKCFYPWPNELQGMRDALLTESNLNQWLDCDLADTQVDIGNGRKLIRELTGMAVSSHYLCIPAEGQGENTYLVYFFPEADGFPVYREALTVDCEENASMEELCRERLTIENHEAWVLNLYFNPWCILYRDGKIAGLDIEPSVYVGEVYEEKASVVGVKELLEQTRNYFEKNYLSEPITITDITLAYNGYVSDGSNGKELAHIVSPFWYVRYYDEAKAENKCLLFNAYSGEFVKEMIFLAR